MQRLSFFSSRTDTKMTPSQILCGTEVQWTLKSQKQCWFVKVIIHVSLFTLELRMKNIYLCPSQGLQTLFKYSMWKTVVTRVTCENSQFMFKCWHVSKVPENMQRKFPWHLREKKTVLYEAGLVLLFLCFVRCSVIYLILYTWVYHPTC